MPALAANLSTLFTEVGFLDRFERAAKAGFRFVECQFPYTSDKADIRAALDANGLEMVLFNLPMGDREAGERGLSIFPNRKAEFRQSLALALDYAVTLGCRQLHCMAGILPPVADRSQLDAAYLDNLRYAATRAGEAGVRILIEPLNPFDMPGYFLTDADHAARIIEAAEVDNLHLQYDFYHQSRTRGELCATFDRLRPLIAHVQIAGNPGRHEPDVGEIDHDFIMRHLDSSGYEGFVGCEWTPKGLTEDGLGWARRWRDRSR